MSLLAIYQRLFDHYGAQQWWPAESPFEVMVGAILTQNTAWTNVERAIDNLAQTEALDAAAIVALSDQALAQALRPSGYFNVKAKRLKNLCRWYLNNGGYRAVSAMSDQPLRESLLSVNGVGPETADDIMLYAFEREVFVIDAYTRRIFARLGQIDGDEGYERLRNHFECELAVSLPDRGQLFNDYHALIVVHAKQHCRVRPRCEGCPLVECCDYRQGEAAS